MPAQEELQWLARCLYSDHLAAVHRYSNRFFNGVLPPVDALMEKNDFTTQVSTAGILAGGFL